MSIDDDIVLSIEVESVERRASSRSAEARDELDFVN